jgi:hypothetical protein
MDEKNYSDKEEEYLAQLMADGMEREEAERFLETMHAVSPGEVSKGLACIRRPPRWMK